MPRRQERHRAREPSRDEEHYIILVHDIPRHCRWQELKDMTRSLGGEQSLKAEVFDVGNGTQMGHCTIKGRSDAVRVYENLCTHGWNGHRVRVKLSALEKNGTLRTVEGLKSSNGLVNSARAPNLSHPATTTPNPTTHTLYATSANPAASMTYNPQIAIMNAWPTQSGAASPTRARAPPTSYSSSNYPPQHSYLPSSAHANTVPPSTHYSTHYPNMASPVPPSPTLSLPVRPINDGTTIFLSGLPYYQSENELRSVLKRYGNVIYLEIHPDSRNPSKNKGTARARYKTSSEAVNAVRDLDGGLLQCRKISVKQERDEPTVTNTSSRSLTSRLSRRPLPETKDGSCNSSKQKKSVPFSSSATSAKSKRTQEAAAGPARGSDRSCGTKSPTGPLVVNGARRSSTRRGRRCERDSDDSSDDSSTDSDSSSDDEDERES